MQFPQEYRIHVHEESATDAHMVLPLKTTLRVVPAPRLSNYRTKLLRTLVLDSATLETWRKAHQARRGSTSRRGIA